jgi:hypothetical protein
LRPASARVPDSVYNRRQSLYLGRIEICFHAMWCFHLGCLRREFDDQRKPRNRTPSDLPFL